MLAKHTLARLGQSQASIDEMLDEARQGHYARIRAFFHSSDDINLEGADDRHLHSVEILASYHAVGRSIDSLQCLDRIRVVALRRNGVRSDSPLPEVTLKPGDVLIIEGSPDEIVAAEIEIMSGL